MIRYSDRLIRKPETAVLMVYKADPTNPVMPQQMCIESADWVKLYPKDAPRSVVFVFRKGAAVKADHCVYEYLTKKYGAIIKRADLVTGKVEESPDDLEAMKFHQLVKELNRYNQVAKLKKMATHPITGKQEEIKAWIRGYRKNGLDLREVESEGVGDLGT